MSSQQSHLQTPSIQLSHNSSFILSPQILPTQSPQKHEGVIKLQNADSSSPDKDTSLSKNQGTFPTIQNSQRGSPIRRRNATTLSFMQQSNFTMGNLESYPVITDLHEQMLSLIDQFQEKIDSTLSRHEKDLVLGYRGFMSKIKSEMEEMRYQAEQLQIKLKQNDRAQCLELELIKLKEECANVYAQVQAQKKIITSQNRTIKQQQSDLQFLQNLLKKQKKNDKRVALQVKNKSFSSIFDENSPQRDAIDEFSSNHNILDHELYSPSQKFNSPPPKQLLTPSQIHSSLTQNSTQIMPVLMLNNNQILDSHSQINDKNQLNLSKDINSSFQSKDGSASITSSHQPSQPQQKSKLNSLDNIFSYLQYLPPDAQKKVRSFSSYKEGNSVDKYSGVYQSTSAKSSIQRAGQLISNPSLYSDIASSNIQIKSSLKEKNEDNQQPWRAVITIQEEKTLEMEYPFFYKSIMNMLKQYIEGQSSLMKVAQQLCSLLQMTSDQKSKQLKQAKEKLERTVEEKLKVCMARSDLEDFFLECVESVRNQFKQMRQQSLLPYQQQQQQLSPPIQQKGLQLSALQDLESFKKEDKLNIIQLLLTSDELMNYVHKKIFPSFYPTIKEENGYSGYQTQNISKRTALAAGTQQERDKINGEGLQQLLLDYDLDLVKKSEYQQNKQQGSNSHHQSRNQKQQYQQQQQQYPYYRNLSVELNEQNASLVSPQKNFNSDLIPNSGSQIQKWKSTRAKSTTRELQSSLSINQSINENIKNLFKVRENYQIFKGGL